MSRALRPAKVRTASIPSCIGGLNAVNSIAEMPETDAIQMDNWVPGVTSCSVRLGYKSSVTGFASAVETLMTYNSATTSKLFAAAGTAIYDASTPGALGAAVVSGLSNARWQYVNFGTVGGQFLVCANGLDPMRLYDGSKWMTYTNGSAAAISSITNVTTTATLTTATAHGLVTGQTVTVSGATPAAYNVTAVTITVTGATTFTYTMGSDPGGSASVVGTLTITYPVITGVTTSLIKDVQVYANRIWLIEKNSFRVWYLPLNSIAGAASSIDFSSLYILGGALAGMVTWQVASPYGVYIYAGFVSTQGEVLLYSGQDPSNAATWSRVGQFRIGRPIGQRFYERAGDDTLLITTDGVIPMSKAAITDRQEQSDAISYKITQLINNDIGTYANSFGWQPILYPFGNKLIVNVPQDTLGHNTQYVMNTLTNAWCRYVNIGANCWALYNDSIYFGGATAVYQAETGNNDNGAAIQASVTPAYSYFKTEGRQKFFTATRPIITANGNFRPSLGLAVDFAPAPAPLSTPSALISIGGAPWNTSPWGSPWGQDPATSRQWQYIGNIGFAATITMASLTRDMAVTWAATDFCFEIGGIL